MPDQPDPFADRVKPDDDGPEAPPEGSTDDAIEIGPEPTDDREVIDRQEIRNQKSGELEIVTSYADGSTTAEPVPAA